MGCIQTSLQTAIIAREIINMHTLTLTRDGFQTRLENTIVHTLSQNTPNIYVHWGVFESGKTRAARNAAIRMQGNGSLVLLVQSYDFSYKANLRDFLRASIGVPDDRASDKLSTFLPANKKTSLMLDHPEFLLRKYGATALVEDLRELDIPILILTRSWEHAVDLKKLGCQLLGEPGLGRWTEDELNDLFKTFPKEIQDSANTTKLSLMGAAVLSGSPGILYSESHHRACKPHMHRARLMHNEWKNGMRALQGQDMGDITGRFPDKNDRFHWD